ncbi:MAG: radical SAM protein [Bryobacteraceae bacterium]|nr:radical SAM protein [Bryobacteraceae bacterium]
MFPLPEQTRLVGIARAAAGSPVLEAKRRVDYLELPTRRYITKCDSERVPFQWTINPYRGCEFGCKYCYARYTHEFMELRDGLSFETRIFAKQWDPRAFAQELRRIPRNHWIAIGTATDPYQPAERRFGVTRRMLEALARERGRRLSITTKSDLMTRDADLLRTISASNVLHAALTITTLDEELARLIEPYATRPALRIKAVETLTKAGIRAGVVASPILPLLNDGESGLDELARAAAGAGALYFGGHVVFLKPCARQVFFPFLERHYPRLAGRYRERFARSSYLRGAYPETVERRIEAVRRRYGLGRRIPDYRPEAWEGEEQRELAFGEPGRADP